MAIRKITRKMRPTGPSLAQRRHAAAIAMEKLEARGARRSAQMRAPTVREEPLLSAHSRIYPTGPFLYVRVKSRRGDVERLDLV